MGGFSEINAGLRKPPHVKDSTTSLAAAVSISGNSNSMRTRILKYLADKGGATDEQIAIDLDMKQSTERPRRIELVEQRLVCDSGRYALTTSKRKAVVWVCC